MDQANNFREAPAGIVGSNAPAPAVEHILAPLTKAFRDACPQIQPEIIGKVALVDMVKGGFDASIRFGTRLAGT